MAGASDDRMVEGGQVAGAVRPQDVDHVPVRVSRWRGGRFGRGRGLRHLRGGAPRRRCPDVTTLPWRQQSAMDGTLPGLATLGVPCRRAGELPPLGVRLPEVHLREAAEASGQAGAHGVPGPDGAVPGLPGLLSGPVVIRGAGAGPGAHGAAAPSGAAVRFWVPLRYPRHLWPGPEVRTGWGGAAGVRRQRVPGSLGGQRMLAGGGRRLLSGLAGLRGWGFSPPGVPAVGGLQRGNVLALQGGGTARVAPELEGGQ